MQLNMQLDMQLGFKVTCKIEFLHSPRLEQRTYYPLIYITALYKLKYRILRGQIPVLYKCCVRPGLKSCREFLWLTNTGR